MLDYIVNILSTVPWYWVLVSAFAITTLENLFPPSPSDTVLVFIGTLIGIGVVSFVPLLLTASLGSIFGFAIMFYLGKYFGDRIVQSKRFSFINEKKMEKPSRWLNKYGYYIIIINRFLSGTRGIISFVAGFAEMRPSLSILYAGISAIVWNAILIYTGVLLGSNWRIANIYLKKYGQIILPIVIGIIILIIIYFYYKNKRNKNLE